MWLMFLGLLLISAGLLMLFLPQKKPAGEDLAAQRGLEMDAQIKGGAVIMIGPIPLVMGSDSKTALTMMLIALAMMIIWIIWANGFKG
jgi:uncharacterized protein (TIGR00304 family)